MIQLQKENKSTQYDYIKNYLYSFEKRHKRPFVMAVDFDGTLCEGRFPEIGDEKPLMMLLVKTLQELGVYTILWTCRSKDKLEDAIHWCQEKGLVFDKINDHADCFLELYENCSPKVFADFYLDDRAYNALYHVTDLVTLGDELKRS